MYNKNDLKFTCGIIDLIARKSKNRRKDILLRLGRERIENLYNDAEYLHRMDKDYVVAQLAEEIPGLLDTGDFDNLRGVDRVPGVFQVGHTYAYMIDRIATGDLFRDMLSVYSSVVSEMVDNYHGDGFYLPTNYLEACFNAGEVLAT